MKHLPVIATWIYRRQGTVALDSTTVGKWPSNQRPVEVGFYHCRPKHIVVVLILDILFPEPCTCGKGEKKPKRDSNGLEEDPSFGVAEHDGIDWHIAHGSEVEDPEKYYPWIVYLDNGCTGAMLDPLHVLTAAHCISEEVKKDASALKVYLKP